MRISEVLQHKSTTDVVTIRPDATVRELVALLAEHNIGALIVSTDGTSVDGIVSERDVVRRLNEEDNVLDGSVSAIMTSGVETAEPDSTLEDLMKTMTDRRIRHVPVLSQGTLTGIISIGDVVKHRIGQLEFERDQLDNYLHQT
jgi:CBS domain-containing protein